MIFRASCSTDHDKSLKYKKLQRNPAKISFSRKHRRESWKAAFGSEHQQIHIG
jgi:hypothetical protein